MTAKTDRFRSHGSKIFEDTFADVISQYPYEAISFLDEGKLRRTVAEFRDHFLPHEPLRGIRRIGYAVKANPLGRVIEILFDEGVTHFDCASIGEIQQVLGVAPEANVLFSAPIKRPTHIDLASRMQVHTFTAQDSDEIDLITEAPRNSHISNIFIRLATLNDSAAMNLSRKYGVNEDDAPSLLRKVSEKGSNVGLAIHPGSQNRDISRVSSFITKIFDVARRTSVKSVNIGGGIPINYSPRDSYSKRDYLQEITRSIVRELRNPDSEATEILSEFGRALVGESVVTAIPILKVYDRGGRSEVHVADGVYTSFADAVVHPGWKYYFQAVDSSGEILPGPHRPATIFGQTCDDGDVLPFEVGVPQTLKAGDYLLSKNSGAYGGLSLASRFCGFEPPICVAYNR